jgi:hypothetical protein
MHTTGGTNGGTVDERMYGAIHRLNPGCVWQQLANQ